MPYEKGIITYGTIIPVAQSIARCLKMLFHSYHKKNCKLMKIKYIYSDAGLVVLLQSHASVTIYPLHIKENNN